MPPANPAKATLKPQSRTRVGNGSIVLADVDQRSVLYRRYREILATLCADMGGDPSEAQEQIARRAAALAVWCEGADADAANGKPLDIATYTTASNSLRRLLCDLGLERRARNITPSLTDYLAATAANA